MKDIIVQKSWDDNLAAILATFCSYYNIKISRTTIFKSFYEPQKMQDFKRIEEFATTYSFECSGGFFDSSTLHNLDFPLFALVKGYRTVIVTAIDESVSYLDPLTGENIESIDEFTEYATGHYYHINPKSTYKAEENYEQLIALEKEEANKKEWVRPEVIELRPENLMTDFRTRV